MDEIKEHAPLLGLICMLFFAGGVATATLFDDNAPQRQPIIIHVVDNAGGMMAGKITDKEIIEGRYTVTAHAYGKFWSQRNSMRLSKSVTQSLII